MKRFLLAAGALAALLIPVAVAQKAGAFAGRWDITVTGPNGSYPGWLEVVENGGALSGRVQPRAGTVHPVEGMKIENGRLIVPVSNNMSWSLAAEGGKLTGTAKRGDQDAGTVAGVKAPALKRRMPKAWTNPEPIFNGKDLTGWEPDKPAQNHWVARDGVLVNETKGANLRTTRKFEDFKLHIEFNSPEPANSGIYLRGRYEIQVEYETTREDKFHEMGSIYGFLAPSVDLPRKPHTWESFDATLVGRQLTLYRDGTKIIDNQEIPGPTGGAIDSNEAEPGPFYIQGDHTGGIQFRNITIQLPKQ